MTNTNVGCRLIPWEESNSRMNNSNLDNPSDAVKSVNRLHELWMLTNPGITVNPTLARNVETAFERMKRVGGIVEATSHDPFFYNRVQSGFINSVFGNIKSAIDGTDRSIRDYLTDLSRQGKGYILTQFERLEIASKAKILNNKVDEVIKRLNLVGTDKATLMTKLTENAQLPYIIDYNHGMNLPTQQLVAKRQAANFDYLKNIGLSENEIVDLSDAAKTLVQAQHEVIAIGKSMDLDVSKIMRTGYLPRVLTPEAETVLNMVVNKSDKQILESISTNPGEWLRKSREFNLLLPNDIDTIDDLLTRGGIFKRINKKTDDTLKKIMEDKGITNITSIRQMLGEGDEPFIIDTFINKLYPGELDFFVETGLMSKLPVDTGKLFDELLSHYKLPFDGLDDIFKYDPVEGTKVYAQSLEKLVANESRTWGLIDGAIEKFGIPKNIVNTDPKFKSYVPLNRAFPESVLKQINDEDLLEKMGETFIHPKIAQIAHASHSLHTNPARLGIVGDVLNFVRKTSVGSLLGTPQMFGKNLVLNIAFLESYGVHPDGFLKYVTSRVWDDSKQLITKTANSFATALTDKKVWAGGTRSPKEMWLFASEKGLINNENMFGHATKNLDPSSFKRTLREVNWMKSEYPEHFNASYLIGKGIKGADQVVDSTLFKYVGYVNNITDNATKFAMLEQVMNPNRPIKIFGNGFFDTIPYIPDPTEAVAWVKKHSLMFDDLPTDNKAYQIMSTVVPFLGYQIKAFQQTGRYLIEHPHRFTAFLKLIQKVNDDFKEDYPEESNAMISPFSNENTPVIPIRIPKEYSGTGKDEFFQWSLPNLILQLGTTDTVNMLLDDLGLFESSKLPSDRSDNPFGKPSGTKLRAVFDDLASPPAKALVTAFTGETSYGQKLSEMGDAKDRTLFGIPVSNKSYFWYTNTFPVIKSYDKLFSYTGLEADAPEYNPITGEFKVGNRSWVGANSDYAKPGQLPNVFGLFTPVTELLGINPTHVDVYYKLAGERRSNLESMIRQAYKDAKELKYQLANAHDSEDAQKKIELYQSKMLFAFYLDTEWTIIDRWAKRHGITSTRAMQQIKNANLQIDQLLPKEEVDRIAQENYMKWVDY